jgi:hypothetical protein
MFLALVLEIELESVAPILTSINPSQVLTKIHPISAFIEIHFLPSRFLRGSRAWKFRERFGSRNFQARSVAIFYLSPK